MSDPKLRVRAHLTPFGPFVTFIPKSHWSEKVRCSVCGSDGYPGLRWGNDQSLSPWQRTHIRGHKPCDYCGKMTVVKLDGMTRVHTRCPR